METDSDKLQTNLRKARETLEKTQTQQAEEGRDLSRKQKNAERYLTKRQVLTSKKDECNKNLRDLGVLPEEAFEKYINVKPERVRPLPLRLRRPRLIASLFVIACETTPCRQRRSEEVCSRQQEGLRTVQQLYKATRPTLETA